MVSIIFKEGQGLGNQLWLYASAKSISEKLGLNLQIQNFYKFKALDFLKLDIDLSPKSESSIKKEMIIFNEKLYYDSELKYYPTYSLKTKKSSNKVKKASISAENIDSSFDNYLTDTKERKDLCQLLKKFSNAVNLQTSSTGCLGLIISGKPGIGKTHLSISVMKDVNKNVLYIDEKYLNIIVSKTCEINFSFRLRVKNTYPIFITES